jgi:hypothetical protein
MSASLLCKSLYTSYALALRFVRSRSWRGQSSLGTDSAKSTSSSDSDFSNVDVDPRTCLQVFSKQLPLLLALLLMLWREIRRQRLGDDSWKACSAS